MSIMKKIAWVIDSTAYISEELKNHPDVFIVPLTIIFNENEVYEDGITLSSEALYTKITQSKELPTTSQPSVGRFMELFETLKDQYETFMLVHIASGISGTINSSKQAAEIVGINYHLIDSKAVSVGITYLIEEGIRQEREGVQVSEIAKNLTEMTENFRNYVMIGKLEQMHKGGRLTKAQMVLGNLLSIKPIVQINKEAKAAVYDKVRTEKRAWNKMYDMLIESIENHGVTKVGLMHGNCQSYMEEIKSSLLEKYPTLHVDIAPLSAVLGVHGGEGTLGIMWFDHL